MGWGGVAVSIELKRAGMVARPLLMCSLWCIIRRLHSTAPLSPLYLPITAWLDTACAAHLSCPLCQPALLQIADTVVVARGGGPPDNLCSSAPKAWDRVSYTLNDDEDDAQARGAGSAGLWATDAYIVEQSGCVFSRPMQPPYPPHTTHIYTFLKPHIITTPSAYNTHTASSACGIITHINCHHTPACCPLCCRCCHSAPTCDTSRQTAQRRWRT